MMEKKPAGERAQYAKLAPCSSSHIEDVQMPINYVLIQKLNLFLMIITYPETKSNIGIPRSCFPSHITSSFNYLFLTLLEADAVPPKFYAELEAGTIEVRKPTIHRRCHRSFVKPEAMPFPRNIAMQTIATNKDLS